VAPAALRADSPADSAPDNPAAPVSPVNPEWDQWGEWEANRDSPDNRECARKAVAVDFPAARQNADRADAMKTKNRR
jgi:hypothetical protein